MTFQIIAYCVIKYNIYLNILKGNKPIKIIPKSPDITMIRIGCIFLDNKSIKVIIPIIILFKST